MEHAAQGAARERLYCLGQVLMGRVASIFCVALVGVLNLIAFPISVAKDLPLTPSIAGAALSAPSAIASYDIEVVLDVEAKTLAAHEAITYVNATTDPMLDLVFHLYLNAFRDGNSLFMQEGRAFALDADSAGWVEVTRIWLAGGEPLSLDLLEDGTLARVILPSPVLPGEEVEIQLDFEAQLPRVFARTGYVGDFFMVGQWFPKLGVWQDGAWSAHPFHANAEFYADFGTYDVTITLPAAYVTGATGLPVQAEDAAGHAVTQGAAGDGNQTVRYRAEAVIDFAWTASPHFREASRTIDGVEVLYLYLPEHSATVGCVLDAAETALTNYGRWFGPYPYRRLTIVDVPDEGQGAGGMEYPTLVTAGTLGVPGVNLGLRLPLGGPGTRILEQVVTHEIGHQWWQSTVAFNEAEEPWLDEGLTDYSSVRLMDLVYEADAGFVEGGDLQIRALDMRRLEYLAGPQVPMYGRAWDFRGMDYAIAVYSKPVLALHTLERTIGEYRMLDVLSTFYQRYQFAHPTTDDFRSVAEEVSGEDLSWFFDGLVYGDGVVDYSVSAVDDHSVTVTRRGELVVPTELLVNFVDGNAIVQPWNGREAQKTFAFPEYSLVRSAEVDPEQKVVVDLNWGNNGLSRRLEFSPWLALVTRLVAYLQNALLALGGL